MPGRGTGQSQIVDVKALIPVQFDDPARRDSPVPQVRAHPQRSDEHRPLRAGQHPHCVHVQVVVVVVADHHGVECGKRLQRHGWRVQSLRAHRARRRTAVCPHRVGQQPVAVDLQQRCRVAEPGHRQRTWVDSRHRVGHRDAVSGSALRPVGEQFEDHQPVLFGVEADRRRRLEVAEDPAPVVRRTLGDRPDRRRTGSQSGRGVTQRPQRPSAGSERNGAGRQTHRRFSAGHQRRKIRETGHYAPWNLAGRFSIRATCASMTSRLPHALSKSSLWMSACSS